MTTQEIRPLEEVTAVISTKLDILIEDFQRFRITEEVYLQKLDNYMNSTNTEVNIIKDTIKWHNIMGSFVISIALTFNTFIYFYIKELEDSIDILQSTGAYYDKNRDVTIEMIEAYKRGALLEATNRRKM